MSAPNRICPCCGFGLDAAGRGRVGGWKSYTDNETRICENCWVDERRGLWWKSIGESSRAEEQKDWKYPPN